MRRYDEYKDTGIGWLPKLPSHWKKRKLKYCFSERSEKNHPEEQMLCATQSHGVIPQSMYQNRVVVVNKGFEGLKLVKVGDFVISLRSFEGGIEYAYYQGIISAAYTILAPIEEQFTDYFKVLFKSLPFIQLLQTCVTGIREGQNINYPLLGRKFIPIPPPTEQEKIVSYLESKILCVDAYVRERERELQLLTELKEAEIANVITRGLNPDVRMKDSGIPWIGLIPEHWEIKQLRSYLKMITIKNKPNEQLLSVVREKGVIIRDIESKEENHNYIPDDLSGYKYVSVGQFVINKMKAWQGSYAVSKYNGIVSPAYYVCELNFPHKEFFNIAIRSKFYVPFFIQYSKGIRVGQWDLSPIGLKSIPFFEPPHEEQQAIVAYIEDKCNKINSLIGELEAEIEYLKEYKQKLIADCVTGQINVQSEI